MDHCDMIRKYFKEIKQRGDCGFDIHYMLNKCIGHLGFIERQLRSQPAPLTDINVAQPKPDPKDVELVRHVMEEGWYFARIRPLPFEKARFDSLREKHRLAEAAFNRIVGNL